MKRYLFATLLSLGFCATACGSSDPAGSGGSGGGTGGNAAAPVPESAFAEQLATVKCDLLFSCGCTGSFSSKEVCVNQTRAMFQDMQANAKELHLSYDASCTGKLIAKLTERGCAPTLNCDPDVCWPYYGTTTLGGACEPSQTRFTTSCAQGSTCWYHDSGTATCGEPCSVKVLPEGEQCMSFQGDKLGDCESGLKCTLEPGGTCVPAAKPGEPCPLPNDCDQTSRCDSSNPAAPTCVALKQNGEACTNSGECVGSLCTNGKCTEWTAICDPNDFPR
ncbi:Secreted trypsin-like serine protease [Minicystis rosea]|nr:Secreted trypsin-like serine protease [Minicystis rosea]